MKRCDDNVKRSIFHKNKAHFKRYLFAFLLMKIFFFLLLFVKEIKHESSLPDSFPKFFSFYKESSFQPPYQDKLNHQMYRHFKNKILSESGLHNNVSDSEIISSTQDFSRLSLLKMILVQLLTFLWKVITLNFMNSNYLLLILEGFILEYHIVEAVIHYSIIFILFAFVFLFRRYVLKKR